MATQVISVVKVAGSAGTWAWGRLQDWAAARQANGAGTWAAEQWPPEVRQEADRLADRLRSHARVPPVVHFVEWVDSWSMGDSVARWLTPERGPAAVRVYGDRHELFGYALPDGGVLVQHLAGDGPHQHPEEDWLVRRLREAAESWDGLYDRAALVVLRRVTAPSVTDEELAASLKAVPTWLSGTGDGTR
jgi:hypothetical protein